MSSLPAIAGPPGRPLVVTAAEPLLDDLLRVLAAAGSDAEVVPGGGPVLRRGHREAPLVLVGADVLGSAAVRALPRRPGVLVVTRGELPAEGWAAAVALGAERVVVLPDDEPWLLARVAGARRPAHRGWLLAVGGSCGGAGASSLAAALALAAAPAGEVVLVDGDGLGGGLDLLVGAESAPGLRWPELVGVRGRVDGAAVAGALPGIGGVRVLAAGREAAVLLPGPAVEAVVEGLRAAGRSVVVDLPRGAAGADAVLAAADLAVLLVPARLRAACAARLLVAARPDGSPPPWSAAHLVVRRQPGGLAGHEVAGLVGRPLLAELGHDAGAVPRAERGRLPPIGPRTVWGAVARRLLAELDGCTAAVPA